MCKCTPFIQTPYCGKGDCVPPAWREGVGEGQPDQPHHRYEIVWKVGGHTLKDIEAKACMLATELAVEGVREFISSNLGVFVMVTDEEMTKERYDEELRAYVEWRRLQHQQKGEIPEVPK